VQVLIEVFSFVCIPALRRSYSAQFSFFPFLAVLSSAPSTLSATSFGLVGLKQIFFTVGLCFSLFAFVRSFSQLTPLPPQQKKPSARFFHLVSSFGHRIFNVGSLSPLSSNFFRVFCSAAGFFPSAVPRIRLVQHWTSPRQRFSNVFFPRTAFVCRSQRGFFR